MTKGPLPGSVPSPLPRRRRLTFAVTLTLTLTLTLPGGSQAFFFNFGRKQGGGASNGGYNNYYQGLQRENSLEIQQLKDRVASLEKFVQDHLTRLEVVEHVATDIGRQECESGEATIRKCTGVQDGATSDMTCVTSPVIGTLPIAKEFAIPFSKHFQAQPVIQFITGTGQGIHNCSTAEVQLVNELGIAFELQDPLTWCPMPWRFKWYACPSALFQSDQGLPLPVDQGSGDSAAEPEPQTGKGVPPAPAPAPAPHNPLQMPRFTAAAIFGYGGGDSDEDDDK